MSLKDPNTPAEVFLVNLIKDYKTTGGLTMKSIMSGLLAMVYSVAIYKGKGIEEGNENCEQIIDMIRLTQKESQKMFGHLETKNS